MEENASSSYYQISLLKIKSLPLQLTPYENALELFYALKIGCDSEGKISISHELEKPLPTSVQFRHWWEWGISRFLPFTVSKVDSREGNKWVIPLPSSVQIGQKWEETGFSSSWKMGVSTIPRWSLSELDHTWLKMQQCCFTNHYHALIMISKQGLKNAP